MDWVWFWGAAGEVVKNAGPLVVGVVGILATYKAGSRAGKQTAHREELSYRRGVYADYLSVAGEIADHVKHAKAAFSISGGPDGATLLEARTSRPSLFTQPDREELQARLARAEALVALLGPQPVADRASNLRSLLVGILLTLTTRAAISYDTYLKHADFVDKELANCTALMRSAIEQGQGKA